MKTLKNKAKKGFTIVELVIVIAVIAILAAVLIPTFTNVMESARESAAMQECKNEWTNYLTVIAADGEYTSNTYYVVYEDGEYVFEVKDGVFNTDSDTTLDYDSATIEIQYTYTYSTTNGKISIWAPKTTKDGLAEQDAVDAAAAAAAAAAANDTANSTELNATSGTVYTTGYDVYATVTDSDGLKYYFALSYDSTNTKWVVDSSESALPSDVTTVNSTAYTTTDDESAAYGYSVTFSAVEQR